MNVYNEDDERERDDALLSCVRQARARIEAEEKHWADHNKIEPRNLAAAVERLAEAEGLLVNPDLEQRADP